MYGRYDQNDYDVDGQYNPYNMKNNSSLMLDQTDINATGVRRSILDLPRKLNDYQRSQACNRGEKIDSVLMDVDVRSSNLGNTYHH